MNLTLHLVLNGGQPNMLLSVRQSADSVKGSSLCLWELCNCADEETSALTHPSLVLMMMMTSRYSLMVRPAPGGEPDMQTTTALSLRTS